MKILLSPTKTWNQAEYQTLPKTSPFFIDKAVDLHKKLSRLSKPKLQELLHTSDDLTKLNYDRIKAWQAHDSEHARPAVFSYGGQVYLGLDAATIPTKLLTNSKTEVFILSGFYGILRLTDSICPYRLEMQSKLSIGKNKNLYAYWKEDITAFIQEECDEDEIIVDLTSAEYGKAVDFKKLQQKVIKPAFKDNKNGVYKNVMTYSKFARGYLARFLLLNKAQHIGDIKKFNDHDYRFNDELSDDMNFVFTRG